MAFKTMRLSSIAHVLKKVYTVIKVMCPSKEWGWLYKIGERIEYHAKPRSRPEVLSSDLYAVGISLIESSLDKTKDAVNISIADAKAFRDGLLIVLLVESSMRRRALAGLRESHFRNINGLWRIEVPADLVKTGSSQTYLLSLRLTSYLDHYFSNVRESFSSGTNDALWVQGNRAMSPGSIYRIVCSRTKAALGFPVSPHRFRNAFATFIAVVDPKNIRMTREGLGHRSFTTTEKHYIERANTRIASRQHAIALAERLGR
ncbi:integrase [Pararhizobium capsulatum DSM 1112]|uniref:Integrase n=1 Tax=Pararhizobium capsulatum DSM 1112 TaxID=1121113 RepID=A0ABU0C2P3_9HYPH|nr:site-specific integrase [Pararhizobium capsulatum]MDQ0323945.1 integrase [Pararhizobium capsulatum DSM 1112]